MTEKILSSFVAMIPQIVVTSIVGAMVLRITTNWICQFRPSFFMAFKVTLPASALSAMCGIGIGALVLLAEITAGPAIKGVVGVIGLGIAICLSAVILKHPETGAIGFKKATFVNLAVLVIAVGIAGMIALVVALIGFIS